MRLLVPHACLLLSACAATGDEEGWYIVSTFGLTRHDGTMISTYSGEDVMGDLHATIEAKGDESMLLTVSVGGCEHRETRLLEGPAWNALPPARRLATAKAAFNQGLNHVAKACDANRTALWRQRRDFDQFFRYLDPRSPPVSSLLPRRDPGGR